jgi:hypothetical protein
MQMRSRLPFLPLLLAGLVFSGSRDLALQNPAPATAKKDISTLRAHDLHQGMLVAADPWVKPEEYKARFGKKNPYDAGIIAIDVYFRNDGAQPIRLNLETIRLTISMPNQTDQELSPARPEAVAALVYDSKIKQPGATQRRLPIPTGSRNKSKEEQELAVALRGVMLSTDLIPPKTVVNGLLYFDLNSHFNYIAFARLYIPDLAEMGTNKPLLFFDVSLGPPQTP